jgi:hypothetical protein
MNIELTIDDLNTHTQTAASTYARRRCGFAYWILLTGILSGAGALALVTAAVTQ